MVFWAAMIFALAAAAIVGLHVSLIFGAPWGFMTMGGRHQGVLPTDARAASLVQAILIIVLAIYVLHGGGVLHIPSLPGAVWGVWIAVAVSAVSAVLNTITPSRRERVFGVPVTLALLGSSLIVGLGD